MAFHPSTVPRNNGASGGLLAKDKPAPDAAFPPHLNPEAQRRRSEDDLLAHHALALGHEVTDVLLIAFKLWSI
jgi:hypothetical protein